MSTHGSAVYSPSRLGTRAPLHKLRLHCGVPLPRSSHDEPQGTPVQDEDEPDVPALEEAALEEDFSEEPDEDDDESEEDELDADESEPFEPLELEDFASERESLR